MDEMMRYLQEQITRGLGIPTELLEPKRTAEVPDVLVEKSSNRYSYIELNS